MHFVLLRFRIDAFTEAAALRLIVFRSSICMRPDSHPCFFIFFSSCGDVAFLKYLVPLTPVLFWYGECVARFLLPNGVFLPCDHGLDF